MRLNLKLTATVWSFMAFRKIAHSLHFYLNSCAKRNISRTSAHEKHFSYKELKIKTTNKRVKKIINHTITCCTLPVPFKINASKGFVQRFCFERKPLCDEVDGLVSLEGTRVSLEALLNLNLRNNLLHENTLSFLSFRSSRIFAYRRCSRKILYQVSKPSWQPHHYYYYYHF